jgi:hypothetical protein
LRRSLLRRIPKPQGTASHAKSDSCAGQQYCQHAFHDSNHIFRRDLLCCRPEKEVVSARLPIFHRRLAVGVFCEKSGKILPKNIP